MNRLPLLLAATFACLAPASAQRLTLKELLPESTILYASVPDLSGSIERFSSMPLAKIWREREVQDFAADLLTFVKAKWEEGLDEARQAHQSGELPFKPDDLLQLRVHGAGFAVTRLGIGMGPGGPMPELGLLVHADFGQSAPIWRQIVEFGLGQLQQREGELPIQFQRAERSVGDRKFETVVITSPMLPLGGLGLHLAWIGDSILFATDPQDFDSALQIAGGQATGKLVGSQNYRMPWDHVKSEAVEVELYAQPGPMIDFFLEALTLATQMNPRVARFVDMQGVERVVDALGLRSIRSAGFVWSYEDGRAVTRSYTYAPAKDRKGLFAGTPKSLDPKLLRYIHKGASSVTASTFDVAALWDTIWNAIDAYDADAGKQIRALIAANEQQLGINLRDDLVMSLGNSFVTWSMPIAAVMSTPAGYLLVEVKDPERLLRGLRAGAAMTDGLIEIADVNRRGLAMQQIRLRLPPGMLGNAQFDLGSMFSPYLMFRDGYLLAALSTSDLKRLSDRMSRADEPEDDIRSHAEFARLADLMPKGDISALSWRDWKAEFEGFYQIVTSFAAIVPIDPAVPIDLKLLPETGTLTKHLSASLSWSQADENGWRSVSYSPFGPEVAVLAGAAIGVGAAVLLPRAMQHR